MGVSIILETMRRRGLLRAATTYVVSSWLVLEVGKLLTEILGLPAPTMRIVFWVLFASFPLVLGGRWWSRRNIGPDAPEEPARDFDTLPFIVGGLALLAAGLFIVTRLQDPPAAEPRVALVAAPLNSIAVLPFVNMTGDTAQDYFSDGLSEELLGRLAAIERLRVAARTSSFSFRKSDLAASEIAARLGVAFLLEGSVRRDANVLRINAQLVDAKSGYRRWSQSYDRESRDIFAIQTGIATAVADALQIKLLGSDIAALSRGGTANPAALDAYLRGRRLVDRDGNEAEWRLALAAFDAAVAIDPGYAAAHAARANVLAAIGNAFATPGELRPTYDAAVAAARRAVAIAPELAEGQSALGFALLHGRLDFAGAAAPYARALKSGSGDADILIRYGLFAVRSGGTAPGLAALARAATLDPLNPSAHKALGSGYFSARRYADSVAPLQRALALNPATNLAHGQLGLAALMLGDLAKARAELTAESIGWSRLSGLAVVEHRRGDRRAAAAAMAQLVRDNGDSALYQQAQVRAQWGETAAALTALEAAYQLGDTGLIFLRNDPLLDPLRREPRFTALLARLGLR